MDWTCPPKAFGKSQGCTLSAYMQELSALERQVSTRNNYIVILKCFFRHLLQIGAIDSDPSLALHCIREKNTPQALERRAAKTLQQRTAFPRF